TRSATAPRIAASPLPAAEEIPPSVAAKQPVADADAALAIADPPDAQAEADALADPAPATSAAAPAAAARSPYAGRAPVVKRQRVVHVERRRRSYSGPTYAQWGGWGGGWSGWPGHGSPYHF